MLFCCQPLKPISLAYGSLETASAAQPPVVPTGGTALIEEDQQPAQAVLLAQ